jgi:hypothetical protein
MKAVDKVLCMAGVFLLCSCHTQTLNNQGLFISAQDRVILKHDEYIESQYEIWVPTDEQTLNTLEDIFTFLQDAESNNEFDAYFKSEIKKIIKNRNQYRVQFIGILEDNKKYIHCNFIPKNEGFSNWKDKLIIVKDGGFWFWQIFYDVDLRKVKKIYINGYA